MVGPVSYFQTYLLPPSLKHLPTSTRRDVNPLRPSVPTWVRRHVKDVIGTNEFPLEIESVDDYTWFQGSASGRTRGRLEVCPGQGSRTPNMKDGDAIREERGR